MIHRKRVLAEFFELVQIKCSTRQERKIGDLLIKRLTDLGGQVIEDNAGEKINGSCGNLIASFKGNMPGLPTIIFTAHMDCVEPCSPVKPQIIDGIITSDGTTILGADDKAGITAILEALRLIKEENLVHGNIQVLFTAAEEGGVLGVKHVNRKLLQADFGYTLDSSGRPGKIITAAPGKNKIFIKIHGKTAHAGIAPEKGINAIVTAGKILAKLPQGRIDAETTCNVGTIHGGQATNIVADLVEIICEARSRNQIKLDDLTTQICDIFKNETKAAGATLDIDIQKDYGPYIIDQDSQGISIAATAANKLGLQVELTTSGGGSDANVLNKYGIPAIVLGVGMEKAHTTNEYIIEEDLYSSAAWVLQIIKDTAQVRD